MGLGVSNHFMFNNYSTIQLYGGNFIDQALPNLKNQINQEISRLSDIEMSKNDDDAYASDLVNKYSLDFPIIDLEGVTAKTFEKDIPAEYFPASFAVFSGRSYKKDVITYYIPYSGDIDILAFKPNPFSDFSGYQFKIDRNEKCFIVEVINFSNDVDLIKRTYEDSVRCLTRDYGSLKANCEDFNTNLRGSILEMISNRRSQLSQKKQFLADLGVPVKPEPKLNTPLPNSDSKSESIKSSRTYDLAISFAGEDRAIAEAIAQALIKLKFTVFYDKYEKADLWGKDLYSHLNDVYSKKAKYCLMIISNSYAKKHWTNHERKAAQAKAFTQNEEYILPLRLDDTEIPGLNITVGYINYTETGLEETVDLLKDKLSR